MSATVDITSDCTCPQHLTCPSCGADFSSYDYEEHEDLELGGTCPICHDDRLELTSGEWFCYGCFTDSEDEVKAHVINPYVSACSTSASYYGAENVGWQNRSGWGLIDNDDISVRYFAPNSDFNQTWTLTNNNTIELSQSHHDSPMGESVTIRPLTGLDVLKYQAGYCVDFDCPECEQWSSASVPSSPDEPVVCREEDCSGSWSVEEFAELFEDDLVNNVDI